jgi:hypothetical protein
MKAGVNEKIGMATSGHKTRAAFDRYYIVDEANVVNAMRNVQGKVPQTSLLSGSESCPNEASGETISPSYSMTGKSYKWQYIRFWILVQLRDKPFGPLQLARRKSLLRLPLILTHLSLPPSSIRLQSNSA